ncbi:hypothetical protein [Cesiribacter sp. SM1]|uniref:hypothetical protein n=1 Tax=Cesiribacter sp. SM1 TaxID=2861196 RepID=UPI001CD61382|nr:hypothetical protein [Cesiribacter sp. SM1]
MEEAFNLNAKVKFELIYSWRTVQKNAGAGKVYTHTASVAPAAIKKVQRLLPLNLPWFFHILPATVETGALYQLFFTSW